MIGGKHNQPTTIKNHGLPEIVRSLKTFSSPRINQIRDIPGTPVWQGNYYETVIPSEQSLNHVREYITNNPLHWTADQENPGNY